MHKLWLKKPKLNYSNKIVDIAQFGSSIFENNTFNDIDIAIIFKKIPIKEQLNESQKIKRQLEKVIKIPIHIKSFDLYSFFDAGNFAKEDILFYGKSLIFGDDFAKRFGFKPKLQISYNLYDLPKKGKVKFHYMLKGKKEEYGLLRKYNGKLLKPGLIEILPECKVIFILSIKKITTNFIIRKVFEIY